MQLLTLAAVAVLKSLLCKLLAAGLCLALFWWRGRRLAFRQAAWKRVLAGLSWRRAVRYGAAVYGTAALLSSAAAGLALHAAGFSRCWLLAAVLLAAGIAMTAGKWRAARAYLQERHRALQADCGEA